MKDIRSFAVEPTSRLHLKDASEELMYAEYDDKGQPVPESAIAVIIYGPGSKQYNRASAKRNSKAVERLRKKGKIDMSPEDQLEDRAEFLTAITAGWENMQLDDLAGEALTRAVYSEIEIGFIADQVAKHADEWGNFSKPSTTN